MDNKNNQIWGDVMLNETQPIYLREQMVTKSKSKRGANTTQ